MGWLQFVLWVGIIAVGLIVNSHHLGIEALALTIGAYALGKIDD